MRLINVLMLTLVNASTWCQSPDALFTKELPPELMRADFRLFQSALEKIHPALYRYTSPAQMDSIFSLTEKRINKPMEYQTFYKLLAGVVSQVRCQHTAITPGQKEMDMITKHAKMFPYEIMWDFDPLKAYVFSDLTHEGGIKPATEILSINGRPIQQVYDTLMKYLFADGYNITSKQVRLVPMDFQYWFYLFLERPETFTMEFLRDGKAFKKKVAAITRGEYSENEKRFIASKDPDVRRLVDHYYPQSKLKPYRLEFLSNSTALLTLKEFGSLKFIHRSFEKIGRKGSKNLIIDVRQNGGGWDDRGFTLFSYLIDKPTYYFDSVYTTKFDIDFLLRHSDKDSAWWKMTEPLLVRYDNGKMGIQRSPENGFIQQPQKNRFKGNVHVLMNGKSMSTTAEFTAAAHYNKLATFIGEESGGAYCGGNGGDFATITLPHTGLSLNLPLSKYVMAIPSHRCDGHGTMPDYPIRRETKDWLDLRDPQMEFALKLIAEIKQ